MDGITPVVGDDLAEGRTPGAYHVTHYMLYFFADTRVASDSLVCFCSVLDFCDF